MNEESAYEQVASEMSANNLRPGLMAKAYAESAGNTNVAKSLYIKYRAKQIIEKDIADQKAAAASRAEAEKAKNYAQILAHKQQLEKDNKETKDEMVLLFQNNRRWWVCCNNFYYEGLFWLAHEKAAPETCIGSGQSAGRPIPIPCAITVHQILRRWP